FAKGEGGLCLDRAAVAGLVLFEFDRNVWERGRK
ncbi:MAG: hypothetical protein ACI8Z5_002522, partial [Lentimonas sp.]